MLCDRTFLGRCTSLGSASPMRRLAVDTWLSPGGPMGSVAPDVTMGRRASCSVAVALQGLWPRHLGDGRYRAASDSYSAHPMVLGGVLDDDADTGLVGTPAPAPIGHP